MRSVKSTEHQMELYRMLNVLLEEPSQEEFKQQMEGFMKLWEPREPDFIKYFRGTYASRAGISL